MVRQSTCVGRTRQEGRPPATLAESVARPYCGATPPPAPSSGSRVDVDAWDTGAARRRARGAPTSIDTPLPMRVLALATLAASAISIAACSDGATSLDSRPTGA